MIAFATLFLGLVLGVQPVEVMVAPAVVRVDLLLDGELAERIEAPPWRLPCDLGRTLAPRLLEAVAFDAEGQEVGRVAQWLNLPRPPAEAQLLLEGGRDGTGVVARLSWDSIADRDPTAIEVTLDGERLASEDPHRFALPAHDPEQLHFLRAELTFAGGVASVLEATFGGTYADRLQTDLTGVPLALEPGGELPDPTTMTGWLARDGESLDVVAVDAGPADVLIVRDQSAQPALDALAAPAGLRRSGLGLGGAVTAVTSHRFVARLARDHRLRLVSTFEHTLRRPDYSVQLFSPSDVYTADDGGLLWLLQNVRATPPREAAQRLADAVAAAGVEAAAGARRRAVVLVLGADPADTSQFAPQTVRDYLQALRVPLLVWRAGRTTSASAWGEAIDVSTVARLETAVKELRRALERQRIVWVEGTHPPQRIALTDRAQGVSLAM